MLNHRDSSSWISKHHKNHRIPRLEITGAEIVGCQSYSYTSSSWCFGDSEGLENHLKTIAIPIVISCFEKTALLGTTFIIRRVLGISDSG